METTTRSTIEQRRVIQRLTAPPTQRQLEQQARARAKGGLTEKGIQEFERKSELEKKKTIETERKRLGLPEKEIQEQPRRVTSISERGMSIRQDRPTFFDMGISERQDLQKRDITPRFGSPFKPREDVIIVDPIQKMTIERIEKIPDVKTTKELVQERGFIEGNIEALKRRQEKLKKIEDKKLIQKAEIGSLGIAETVFAFAKDVKELPKTIQSIRVKPPTTFQEAVLLPGKALGITSTIMGRQQVETARFAREEPIRFTGQTVGGILLFEAGTGIVSKTVSAIPRQFAPVSRPLGKRAALRLRSKRKFTKAELRKRSFGARQDRRMFVDPQAKEIGLRIKGKELKARGVKERQIRLTGDKVTVVDIGVRTGAGRQALATQIRGGEIKSFVREPQISSRQRPIRGSQALSDVRKAGRELDKFLSGGGQIQKAVLVAKQRPGFKDIPLSISSQAGLRKRKITTPRKQRPVEPTTINMQALQDSFRTRQAPQFIEPEVVIPRRGGFRRGQFERLRARAIAKKKEFILVETEQPLTNLPAIAGEKSLAIVNIKTGEISKLPTARLIRGGQAQQIKQQPRLIGEIKVSELVSPIETVSPKSKIGFIPIETQIQTPNLSTKQFQAIQLLQKPVTTQKIKTQVSSKESQKQKTEKKLKLTNITQTNIITTTPPPTETKITKPPVPKIKVPKPPKITKPPVPKIPKITPPIPIKLPSSNRPKTFCNVAQQTQGYDVYVKRKLAKKGKTRLSRGFTKVNKRALTQKAALGKLMKETDTYVNRSGFIKPKGGKGFKDKKLISKFDSLKSKFRQSKTDPRVLVEKTAFAIDSPFEKKGIPYEAARLRKAGLIKTKVKQMARRKKKKTTRKKTTRRKRR